MSKVDAYETALLQSGTGRKDLYRRAVASTASTTIWVSLHKADPADTGTQATSETTYTGYLRVATDRTTSATTGWTVVGNSASPSAAITFATCSASSTTVITHFSVGISSAGAGTALYNGTVTPNISVTTNVTPSLTTASAITED